MQHLSHQGWVGLPPAQLHDLPFQEVQCRILTLSVILGGSRVGFDGLIAKLLDRAGIRDLNQSFFLYNGGGRLPGLEHL